MASLEEYRNERLRKLEELQKLGINPYPAVSKRSHQCAEITSKFADLEGNKVTVVGRIARIRSFGKLAFVVVRDNSGEAQLYIKEGEISKLDSKNNMLGISELKLLDPGDFVQASGEVVKTEKGEESVLVNQLTLLSKSLRPMPLSHETFSNVEERFRRRYVDMNINSDVRQRFKRRSIFWQANREFLNKHDFSEVNIPVLEHTTGGADAKPFVTHMDALDEDYYLRISHELPLKKLIGGGFEKVYDIGPRFRNEHSTDEHLPEHVAMEWYWAYADWRDGMKLMEEMFRWVLGETFNTNKFSVGGHEVDLDKNWDTVDYAEVLKEGYQIDPYHTDIEEVKSVVSNAKLVVEDGDNLARSIDKLWKQLRSNIAGPAWLVNVPKYLSPLAKTDQANPQSTQRFQAVIGGTELGNGYSELNNPLEQLARFKAQQELRDSGDEEAQMLDIDYVEMLEYGMPPTCGWGHSERLFWVFEGVSAREGVPFPHMRRDASNITKSIYPEIDL